MFAAEEEIILALSINHNNFKQLKKDRDFLLQFSTSYKLIKADNMLQTY